MMMERPYLKAQQEQYLKHIRESTHNHMFPTYFGGIVQHERLPVPALNLEPSSLYVGNSKMNYPRSLIQDVQRTVPRKHGGAFDFNDIMDGIEKVNNIIPPSVKAAAIQAMLMGAGRKPRKPRRKAGAFNFNDVMKGAEDVYNHIPAPIKDAVMNKAMTAMMGAGRKPRMGGINRLKKAKRWTGFVSNQVVPAAAEAARLGIAVAKTAGGVKRMKKPSARGEMVKKIMREKHLSLPQASSYVKQHNLY
jgi:hypothetical protein